MLGEQEKKTTEKKRKIYWYLSARQSPIGEVFFPKHEACTVRASLPGTTHQHPRPHESINCSDPYIKYVEVKRSLSKKKNLCIYTGFSPIDKVFFPKREACTIQASYY